MSIASSATRLRRWCVLLVLLALTAGLSACSSPTGEDGNATPVPEVDRPDPPADGAPLAFVTVRLGTGEEDRWAEIMAFNYTEGGISTADVLLVYEDGTGEMISSETFTIERAGEMIVGPGDNALIRAGEAVPETAMGVRVGLISAVAEGAEPWITTPPPTPASLMAQPAATPPGETPETPATEPTSGPTTGPTSAPTTSPTTAPALVPTPAGTGASAPAPSVAPQQAPSVAPQQAPSVAPQQAPTQQAPGTVNPAQPTNPTTTPSNP